MTADPIGRLIERLGAIGLTESTRAELERLGIPIDARVTTIPNAAPPADAVLVCLPFDLLTGLAAPDNRLDRCGRCGRPVQYRPHNAAIAAKLCAPCLLAETGVHRA